jgi:hypothetical protein
MAPPPDGGGRLAERGRAIEGYAFTFCKVAFVALICRQYTLLVASGLAVVLYVAALALGVKEWRCWFKPPWVVIVWAAVFVAEAVRLLLPYLR